MPDIPVLIKLHCQICNEITIHIRTLYYGLECLKCRAAGREQIPVTHFSNKVIIYAKS